MQLHHNNQQHHNNTTLTGTFFADFNQTLSHAIAFTENILSLSLSLKLYRCRHSVFAFQIYFANTRFALPFSSSYLKEGISHIHNHLSLIVEFSHSLPRFISVTRQEGRQVGLSLIPTSKLSYILSLSFAFSILPSIPV